MFSDHEGNTSETIMTKPGHHNIKLGVIEVGPLQSKILHMPLSLLSSASLLISVLASQKLQIQGRKK